MKYYLKIVWYIFMLSVFVANIMTCAVYVQTFSNICGFGISKTFVALQNRVPQQHKLCSRNTPPPHTHTMFSIIISRKNRRHIINTSRPVHRCRIIH